MFDPYLEWLKIPVERRPPTHYELLGLPDFESESAHIHTAVMERMALVRRYQLGEHSDIVVQLLGELSGAFNCLSDPQRRQAYDEQLRVSAVMVTQPRSERMERPSTQVILPPSGTIGRGPRNRKPSPIVWLVPAAMAVVAVIVLSRSWSSPPTASTPVHATASRNLATTIEATAPSDDPDENASGKGIAALGDSTPKAPTTPEPAVARGPQIRYFGYATAGPAGILANIAPYTNVVFIRDWLDHSNEVIVAAQKAGLPMVLCLNNKEMTEGAAKLDTVLSRRADAVLAVCWFNPYAAGHSPSDVANAGRRLKQAHPQVQFWVAELAKPSGQTEVGFVPGVVDALVILGVADSSGEMVRTRADDCLPRWMEKAGGRPVLWFWLSGVRGSQGGVVSTTEPGTFRACLDAARRHQLAGVIFDRYGQPPWQERIPIDARPELVDEIRQLSREERAPGASSAN